MNNEVKNVPSLRFPGFTDEWKTVKLGDIAKFSKGAGIPKADINQDGDREAIRYGELYTTYGEVVTNVHSKVVSKPSDILSDANDVLIPSSGETAIDISTATYVGKSGVAIGGDLNIVKTDENGKFLSYYFNHKKRIDIAKLAQGVSVVHLYGSDLKTLKVNLPSEEEQEKIADFFTAVDERIELASLKVEKLETYKRGLTQKIFTRTLRFKRDDGSDFPEWKGLRLGDFLSIPKNTRPEKVDRNKIISVKLHLKGVVKNDNIDTITLGANYFTRYSGQFIYGKQNIFNGALGIIPSELNGYVLSTDIPSLDINSKVVDTNFFSIITGRKSFYKPLEKLAIGSGSKRIHEKELLKVNVVLPSLGEQQKIATFLSQIDEKITLETGKLEELKKFKKALLQRMFV